MGSLWIYCKRFLRFLSDPDRLCCSPFWKLITASRILAGARHVARRATEGRRLKGTLPVASLQTSFGFRLSRIHFSPLRGGEMNAWQTNPKERLRGGYPASRVSFDLPRYLKGDRGTKCRVKKKKDFPVVAKRTAKDARGGTLLGLPKNGSVVMILQLPCTSALLSATFYCKSTHEL